MKGWKDHFFLKLEKTFTKFLVSCFSALDLRELQLKVTSLSCVWLFATPWTVAYQVPPSMGFSRQEYWSGLPFPSPGALPDPGIEPGSPALQTDALPSEPPGKHTIASLQIKSIYPSNIKGYWGFRKHCIQSTWHVPIA